MNKMLFIVGSTATGKTKLALQLMKVIPGEMISADSRQVYMGMDIGTGKDRPVDGTKIQMLDEVLPDQEWSVSQFELRAEACITKTWEKKKLPLLVGGTGLYLQSITHAFETLHIPQNLDLRKNLEKMSVSNLQKKLSELNSHRISQMNNSDRNNPRRLVRAIEVAEYTRTHEVLGTHALQDIDAQWIGLQLPLEKLEQRIRLRVLERMHNGMEKEVRDLMKIYPSWKFPSFSATGYREIRAYIEGTLSKQKALDLWILHEFQYAKRQLTWFKKQKNIVWFDADDPKTQALVENQVYSWYHDTHATD